MCDAEAKAIVQVLVLEARVRALSTCGALTVKHPCEVAVHVTVAFCRSTVARLELQCMCRIKEEATVQANSRVAGIAAMSAYEVSKTKRRCTMTFSLYEVKHNGHVRAAYERSWGEKHWQLPLFVFG